MADQNEVPDTWPPADAEGLEVRDDPTVPLFPLANVWLFPYVLLPLHVFEERYRKMIEDSLDGPGRIVIGTVPPEHVTEMEGAPPVYPIAGMGEIAKHVRHDDGRFDVLVFGLSRVTVEEVESDQPYRLVRARPVPEIQVPREREKELREKLLAAISERVPGDKIPNLPQVPTSCLADTLILHMPLPHEKFREFHGELDAEKRALAALQEHRVRPPLPQAPDTGERFDDLGESGEPESGE